MASLYDLTIPILTKILKTEVDVLKDAEKYAKENGKSIDELLKAQLIPDMYAATIQIGITVLFSRKVLQLLAGSKIEYSVKPASLEESYAQIQEVLSELATVKPEAINGREAEIIEFSVGKPTTKAPAIEWFVQVSSSLAFPPF
ncbi:uncharacterized protein GGS22DRAFT_159329 [Annulohypoxylon maeteangense]|uniref:uncharacterized protein n=1 Tax=Annulohypoxylon maeteangense TaxID=1927788 RepID=UPI002007D9B8|nr:uncharacterized protein GGS22DRAFT_159329 [Annulohypoxylon maeteangense]KAI0887073.1 hypothetical protein GGS22DRAFT_159329 [Annulohypoxylon maeteangense]